jgi:hypothetical protein
MVVIALRDIETGEELVSKMFQWFAGCRRRPTRRGFISFCSAITSCFFLQLKLLFYEL